MASLHPSLALLAPPHSDIETAHYGSPDNLFLILCFAAFPFYLAAAMVLDALFLKKAWQLLRSRRSDLPMRAFRFSINYLALLFAALLVDHYLPRAPF